MKEGATMVRGRNGAIKKSEASISQSGHINVKKIQIGSTNLKYMLPKKDSLLNTYLIFVTGATGGARVNFFGGV